MSCHKPPKKDPHDHCKLRRKKHHHKHEQHHKHNGCHKKHPSPHPIPQPPVGAHPGCGKA